MKMLSIEEARAQLSDLLDRAERGEEVVITRNGTPVVRLVPESAPARQEYNSDVAERAAAWIKLQAMMEEGLPFDGVRWSRREIYDDRTEELEERWRQHRT
ncbi:type II toxin-antitoxin system Phd/YefM family antitoxin [Azospirillum halopraeferens]|uniref:type II toxin-antitoxin system Phd/YefM family antitoxin n=1 Tax=Azospirillum halopraeferens TaxID=34010 RepID=UPI000404A825|nr:type II toxin-antitoxin system prevent-host-death family antitoxin [Azospirillum halopraeferens]